MTPEDRAMLVMETLYPNCGTRSDDPQYIVIHDAIIKAVREKCEEIAVIFEADCGRLIHHKFAAEIVRKAGSEE